MAPTGTDREKLVKQAKALSYLRTGQIPDNDAFDVYNDEQLRRQIKEYRTAINQNWDLDVPAIEQDIDEPVNFAEQPPAEPLGTKEKLIGLMDREIGGTLPANEALMVKAAMSVAAYDVNLDSGKFSTEEEEALKRFRANIDSLSIEQIANSNFITNTENANREMAQQLAAEQLVAQETELKGTVASMLVYGGYLKPEDVDNEKRVASALNRVITLKTPHQDQVEVQSQLLDTGTWELKPGAAAYLIQNLKGLNPQNATLTGELLRDHLGGNPPNPELVKLAQGYLAAQPGNDGVKITGEFDQATYDAALKDLQKPLSLPADIYDTDGSIRADKIMQYAVDGQLYLPMDKLSAEDRKLVDSMPYADERGPRDVNCKERILADRLILQDPEGYIKLLEEYNKEVRAVATLDNQNVIDLNKIEKENVAPVVAETKETIETVSDLPPNFAEVLVAYAAKNGGDISVSEIDAITKLAKSGQAGDLEQSLRTAEAANANGALTGDEVRLNIKLDPTSPDFAANMELALKYAYVLQNHAVEGADGKPVTVASIPADVATGFQKVAASQTTVSTTGTDNLLQAMKLPTNTFSVLMDASADGVVRIQDIPNALLKTEDNQFVMKLDPNDPLTMLYRSNIYEDGPQKAALQEIINTGEFNLKDPHQLSIALQVSLALKDNVYLEDVASNTDLVAKTEALANGYLGTKVEPAVTPDQPKQEEKPAGTPVADNTDKLKGKFAFAHDGTKVDTDAAPKVVVADNDAKITRTLDIA